MYKLKNKKDEIVPFIKNTAQILIAKSRKASKEKRWCVRLLILKARQLWCTTDAGIDYLDNWLMHRNKEVAIRAHDKPTQKEILRKIKYTYNKIPAVNRGDWIKREKPHAWYDNADEISFSNDSRIRVALDTSWTTVSSLHITELWKVDDAEAVMANLLPSVPKYWNITIESTAKWINYLYRLWNDCVWWDWPYDTLFLAWFHDDTYWLELDEWETEVELPKQLEHLHELDITEEQKKRYKAEYGKLDRTVFQEYPSTPEEAFLTSGEW